MRTALRKLKWKVRRNYGGALLKAESIELLRGIGQSEFNYSNANVKVSDPMEINLFTSLLKCARHPFDPKAN